MLEVFRVGSAGVDDSWVTIVTMQLVVLWLVVLKLMLLKLIILKLIVLREDEDFR